MPEQALRELAARMRADFATLAPAGAQFGDVARAVALDGQLGGPVRAAMFLGASGALGAAHGYLGSGWATGGVGLLAWMLSLGTESEDIRLTARELHRASAAALTYQLFRGVPRAQPQANHA
jgi:hypothetical protein